MKSKTRNSRWSQRVTETSDALDLEPGVFTLEDPAEIARSLKRSAERSERRRSDPYRSAMSMLTFYINRAGRRLPRTQRRRLEQAKDELRILFGRPPRRPSTVILKAWWPRGAACRSTGKEMTRVRLPAAETWNSRRFIFWALVLRLIVAPFPLMIFTLLVMSLAQKESVVNWAEDHIRMKSILAFFSGSVPTSLGKPFRQD